MPKYSLFLICLANAFSSVVSTGVVAPIRTLSITPLAMPAAIGTEPTAVADIRIDNNLPDYELILEFADDGTVDRIAEVTIQGIDGTLGRGCEAPVRTALVMGAFPGQFVWRPGPQQSATIGYRVRVLVAWKAPPFRQPRMAVCMQTGLP